MDLTRAKPQNNTSMIPLPRISSKHKRTILRKYFREYCESTGIHGFRYLAEKRSFCERLSWAIFIIISIVTCGYMIHDTFRKYSQGPVIVSFATKESPIFSIPFPAVTVCPLAKISAGSLNYTDIIHKARKGNLTTEEQKNGQYMSLICKTYKDNLFPTNKTFTDDFFNVLHEHRIPVSFAPKFMGSGIHYSSFKPIITDQGVCYTFNMLDREEIFKNNVAHFLDYHTCNKTSEWSIDHGYSNNKVNSFPRRALLSGADNALIINFQFSTGHLDYMCAKQVHGFSVTLHMPNSIPRPNKLYFHVPYDTAVNAAILPKMMTTSQEVKGYHPSKRECYLSRERDLKFFKIYTPDNCRLECLANYTLKLCGCTAFFMPRDNSTLICGNGNINCMKKAEMDLMKNEVNTEVSRKSNKYCDCMPLCSELSYEVELSQNEWDWDKQMEADYGTKGLIFKNIMRYSSLYIFFKSEYFWTTERNELYGPTDLLANFGGLLGLFTGFSLLSLVEIIYFLTLRIFCNIKQHKVWAGYPTDVK